MLEGRREKRQCDLVCGVPVGDWANASFILTSDSCDVSVLYLIFWGVIPFLRNECGI